MTEPTKQAVREYWEQNPNAYLIGGKHSPNTKEFFETVAIHRYRVEPCIPEMADFPRWTGLHVLEVGCGMGTDLRQFSKAGAAVVGVDLTWRGVQLAEKAFELFRLPGAFVVADAEALPFCNEAFDLVYSHGVIHHTPNAALAVAEMHRVIKPGAEARVMVYHRDSYHAKIIVGMLYVPLLRVLLWLFPRGPLPKTIERMLPPAVKSMYLILQAQGYSRERIFSLSTDPSSPGAGNANPLSRCYSRREAKELFSRFQSSSTTVRQLYFAGFIPTRLRGWLERHFGWFLFVRAVK